MLLVMGCGWIGDALPKTFALSRKTPAVWNTVHTGDNLGFENNYKTRPGTQPTP
jgi:hypothetical protein